MLVLTIWRHGAAEEAAVDRDRELTVAGRDDVGFGCHQFHHACRVRNIAHPDHILYSPWVRTVQTAEIVASAFTHATVAPDAALQPGSKVAAVDRALSGMVKGPGGNQHVLVVSHQPLVSQLVDHYLGDDGSVPPIPPGGLVTLSLDMPAADCGKLLFWAFPPEFGVGV
jgi:phosphohistidine phosphatase